jgi:hypothetical protein
MGTRRPTSYRDPRKPPKGDRGGRDHGEPVVYRGHQIAGDYKANWERYQAGLGLAGAIQRPTAGGYQLESGRSNTGDWTQGVIALYCPDSSGQYGQILHFDAAPQQWQLEIRGAIAPITVWRWDGEPSCTISGAGMTPLATAAPSSGTVTLSVTNSTDAQNFSFSQSSGYGVAWQFLQVLSVQPSSKQVILQRKP